MPEFVTLYSSDFPDVYRVTGRKMRDVLLETIDGTDSFCMSYESVENYHKFETIEELKKFMILHKLSQ
jgi:hypothetical protein